MKDRSEARSPPGVKFFALVQRERFSRTETSPEIKEDNRMNRLRHKVRVNVKDRSGDNHNVVTGTTMRLPARLLRILFGEMEEVMLITPGKSVEGIEIREIGGDGDEQNL